MMSQKCNPKKLICLFSLLHLSTGVGIFHLLAADIRIPGAVLTLLHIL